MHSYFKRNAATWAYRGDGFFLILQMTATERTNTIPHIDITLAMNAFFCLKLVHWRIIPYFFDNPKRVSFSLVL